MGGSVGTCPWSSFPSEIQASHIISGRPVCAMEQEPCWRVSSMQLQRYETTPKSPLSTLSAGAGCVGSKVRSGLANPPADGRKTAVGWILEQVSQDPRIGNASGMPLVRTGGRSRPSRVAGKKGCQRSPSPSPLASLQDLTSG